MKTLKFLCLVLLILSFGCSNDDDYSSSNSEQTYFPTQITTVQTGSTNAETMNIQYDGSNRISQFSFVNGAQTNTYDTTYNSDGIITSILHTRPDTTTLEYAFEYSNGRVSQMTIINPSNSIPLDVIYNEFGNSYIVIELLDVFRYDSSGNIINFNLGAGDVSFSYSSNQGIFKNIPDSFPFILTTSIGLSSNLFNSFLFSTKQLTGILHSGTFVNVETTRDEQNQIETVKFIDATSFDISSTTTITYELR